MSVKMEDLFQGLQEKMLASLGVNKIVNHPSDKGDVSEEEWRVFFKKYLPTRYSVAKATIVDSTGETSDQIDLVIYDNYYSPLVFEENGVTYIPAESVFAVFEIKQNLNESNLLYAFKKFDSVRKLKRTSAHINQMDETRAKKNVKPIFGGLLTQRSDWRKSIDNKISSCFSTHYHDQNDITFITCSLNTKSFLSKKYNGTTINDSGNMPLLFMYKHLLIELQNQGNPPAINYNEYF